MEQQGAQAWAKTKVKTCPPQWEHTNLALLDMGCAQSSGLPLI